MLQLRHYVTRVYRYGEATLPELVLYDFLAPASDKFHNRLRLLKNNPGTGNFTYFLNLNFKESITGNYNKALTFQDFAHEDDILENIW